jgi:hypothetical protein
MKKQTQFNILALLLIGICLLSSDNNLLNVSAYETSSRTKLTLEQNSNNFEVASQLASVGTYSYFTEPTLNSEALSHDLTVVDVSRIQSYNKVELPTVYNSSCSNRITRVQNITEQTISAPFDTQFNVVSGYNTTSRFYTYPQSYSVTTGSTSSGSVSVLSSNGSSSLVLKAASNLPTGYLSASSYTKTDGSISGAIYYRAYLRFTTGFWLDIDVQLLDYGGNVLSTTNFASGTTYDTYLESTENIYGIRFKTPSGYATTEKEVDVDYLALQSNLDYVSAVSYSKTDGSLSGTINIDATYSKSDSKLMIWKVDYTSDSQYLTFSFSHTIANIDATYSKSDSKIMVWEVDYTSDSQYLTFSFSHTIAYHRANLRFTTGFWLDIDVQLLDYGGNVLSTTNFASGTTYDTFLESTENIYGIRFKTPSGDTSIKKEVDVDYLALQTNLDYSIESTINIGFNQTRIVNDLDYAIRYKVYADSEAALLSSALTIDGQLCLTPYNTFTSAYFNVSQTGNLSISLSFSATGIETNIYLEIDYVECNPIYNAIEYSTINQFGYAISGITHYATLNLTQNSITAQRISGIVFVNLNFSFDSTELSEYDHINDLVLNSQNLNFTFNISSGIVLNFNSSLSFTQNEWTLPSAQNLRVNGENVIDESYNSGYVSLIDYPDTIIFTADSSNLLFNFTIVNHFTFETDLTIISHTYYMKSLVCSAYHNLVLTRIDYLFDAGIKHSYVNNVDYSTAKTINPNFTWVKSASVKIEVILNDDAYLPLNPINLISNSTSLLELIAESNIMRYQNLGTCSIDVEMPLNWQALQATIEISNIHYIEQYSHMVNNYYSESYETQNQQNPSVFTTQTDLENYSHTENWSSYREYYESQNPRSPVVTTSSAYETNLTSYTSNSGNITDFYTRPLGFQNQSSEFSTTLLTPTENITNAELQLWDTQNPQNLYRENMTYYYDGNSTFENGSLNNWYSDTGDVNIESLYENSAHQNYLHLNFTSASPEKRYLLDLGQNYPTGTIEFYMKKMSYTTFSWKGFSTYLANKDPAFKLAKTSNTQWTFGDSNGEFLTDEFSNSVWIHFKFVFNTTGFAVSMNSGAWHVRTWTYGSQAIRYLGFNAYDNCELAIDAVDFSMGDSSYYIGRNTQLKVRSPNGHYSGQYSFDLEQVNTQYNQNLTLNDYKGNYAQRWGTTGTPSTFSFNTATGTIQSSTASHLYPFLFNSAGAGGYCYTLFTATSSGNDSFWFYYEQTTSSEYLVWSKNDFTDQFYFTVDCANQGLDFRDGTGSNIVIPDGSFLRSRWYHISISYTKNTKAMIYLNGNLTKITDNVLPNEDIAQFQIESGANGQTCQLDAFYHGNSYKSAFDSLLDADVKSTGSSHIVNSYQNHNKINLVNSTFGFRKPSESGNFEFWLNSNYSINILINGTSMSIASTSNAWQRFNYYYNSSTTILQFNSSWAYYLDAVDFSSSLGYFFGRNAFLNNSANHWNLQAFPNAPSGNHYEGRFSGDLEVPNAITTMGYTDGICLNEFAGHNKVSFFNQSLQNTYTAKTIYSGDAISSFSLEYWYYTTDAYHWREGISCNSFWFFHEGGNTIGLYNAADTSYGGSITINQWNHYRLTFDGLSYNFYLNNVLSMTISSATTTVTSISLYYGIDNNSPSEKWSYIDAIDFSVSDSTYFTNRNQLVNWSTQLNCWAAYPQWNSGFFDGAYQFNTLSEIIDLRGTASASTPTIINSLENHNNVANLSISAWGFGLFRDIANTTTRLDFWGRFTPGSDLYICLGNTTGVRGAGMILTGSAAKIGIYQSYVSESWTYASTPVYSSFNAWHYYSIVIGTNITIMLDGIVAHTEIRRGTPLINKFTLLPSANTVLSLDSVDFDSSTGYFANRFLLENTTASPLTMNFTIPNNLYSLPDSSYAYRYVLSSAEGAVYISDEFQFTILNIFVAAPDVIVGYESIVPVGKSAIVSISAFKTIFNINNIWIWNNLTNTNNSLGMNLGNYSASFSSSVSQYYSIEIQCIDVLGNWRKIRIDDLFIAKNSTYLTLSNLKNQYYQTQNLNITGNIYQQNAAIAQNKSLTIYYPNGTLYQSSINSSYFNIGLLKCGWYKLNMTYAGSTQFLASSIETVFEILPATVPILEYGLNTQIKVGEIANITIRSRTSLNTVHSTTFYNNMTESTVNLGGAGEYSRTLSNLTRQYYSIEMFVNDSFGLFQRIRIDNLFIAKNSSYLTLQNLKNQYYQNSEFNITGIIHQQNSEISENCSVRLTAPNSTVLTTTLNSTMDLIDFSYICGYYTLNLTYNGSNQFLASSIETVFEVLPTSRGIANASEPGINIRANTVAANSNIISLSNLGNIFEFDFVCNDGTTFDIEISFLMNYSETFEFNALYSFEFDANSNLTNILIQNVTVFDVPAYFDSLFYNGHACLLNTDYSWLDSTTVELFIAENQTMLNRDYFTIGFSSDSDSVLIQADAHVHTDAQSVHMNEYYVANRTFAYYYFAEEYDANSVTLEHMRTHTYMSLLHEELNYYFNSPILSGDIFLADWDLNPNFLVNYSILTQTELNTSIAITVKSDFYIENVSVSIFLPTYFPSWSAAASMTLDKKLEFDIPYSSNATQTFILTGWNNNFTHSYSIQSNSSSIRIEYSAIAHANLTDVLDTISLNYYYGAWTCSNLSVYQDYETKILSFTIPAINHSRVYYLFEGFGTIVDESFEILSSNGTFAQIEYFAYSYLPQTNYPVTLELAVYDVFQENWSCSNESITSLTQNAYSKRLSFIIPQFQGSLDVIFTGISNVPTAIMDVNRMFMNQSLDISTEMNATYIAFLNYTKYSTQWFVDLDSNWILDGIHYQNETYDILNSGYFECPGWGTSISSSYLKFDTNPIRNITRIENGSFIYIIIDCSLPLDSANYLLEINLEQSYTLVCNYSTISVTSQLQYIMGIDLVPGENILIFEIQTVDIARNFWFLFPILILVVGYIAYYVYQKYWKNRSQKDKINSKKLAAAAQKKTGGSK